MFCESNPWPLCHVVFLNNEGIYPEIVFLSFCSGTKYHQTIRETLQNAVGNTMLWTRNPLGEPSGSFSLLNKT